MFGFEFANKKKHHRFPTYDNELAIKPEAIQKIAPLVWQEHCVECAMPACYKTCAHYKPRSDGRCRLFKYGIELFDNPHAILNQNVVIDMNEWAKLETFWFTSGMYYDEIQKTDHRVKSLGRMAQTLKNGKLRRLCYYIKEYYTRKIGDYNSDIPQLFLCEIINENEPYVLNLENRANNQIVYRTNFKVNRGFNRFLIPTKDFNYMDGYRNNLLIYPDGNNPQLINFVSLELITLKEEFLEQYLPKSQKKVKCVVWDLDNTIWTGILGEDGIDGIKIREDIIEIIKNFDAKGIINSIASKNYEAQAIEALKKFGISEYFVCPMVNWSAKSENIKTIVKTLDIDMDTFVFIDDSFFELNEVRINCPGIRVCDVSRIKEYVQSDVFNVPITEDSKRRRISYQEIAIRNKAEMEFKDDVTEFLKDCNMVIHVDKPKDEELMRCYELVQRTNQLNLSAERLTLEQITEIVKSDQYDCYRIKVNDRFGDYGLVGFAIFYKRNKKSITLRHFVFSCRAARKKIEQTFFEYMIEYYKKRGIKELVLNCRITEKNQLMRQVLEDSKLFEKIEENEIGYKLVHNIGSLFIPLNILKIENN